MSDENSVAFPDGFSSSKTQLVGVSCSVCLEAVTDAGERSFAKLKCGHHFHLDCIGSAFNAKGRMQCPNCRQVDHGEWQFANGCFIHEGFVNDLTHNDEVEVYNGVTNVGLSHTPWCPYQGSYARFWLTFEENDSNGNFYQNSRPNMRRGTSASAARHICPYLATEGYFVGRPLQHVEDILAFQTGPYTSRNSRRTAGFSSALRNHWQWQASPTSASNRIPTSYEWSSQNYNSSGRFLDSSANDHGAQNVFRRPQFIHTGTNQRPRHSGSFRHFFGQTLHGRSARRMHGNTHPFNASLSGYPQTRLPRHSELVAVPFLRPFQVSSSEWGWMNEHANEHGPWGAQSSFGQNLNQPHGRDEMVWPDNQLDPWTTGLYVPHAQLGTSHHLWALVPPGNNHVHRTSPNVVPSNYHGGHLFGAGLIPRPIASSYGYGEHVTDGGFTWLSPGSR